MTVNCKLMETDFFSRDVSCCWLSSVSWLLTTFKHQHPSIPMLSCYDISTTFSQNCCDSSKNQEGSYTCKPFLRKHFRSKRPLWALSLLPIIQWWVDIFLAVLTANSFERRHVRKCESVYCLLWVLLMLSLKYLGKGNIIFKPWHELLPSLLWRFFGVSSHHRR